MSGTRSVWSKVFRFFASASFLLVAIAGFAVPAQASTHFFVAQGNSDYVSPPAPPVRTAGGNMFFETGGTITYHGGVDGVATIQQSFVVHADGSFNGHATETCASCTIGGRTGSYVANVVFSGLGPNYAGHEVIHGVGGLAGLHCEGVFTGVLPPNPSSSYSYDCHFN